MRPSHFPGLKDPRKLSRLGRIADRDVEVEHGVNRSRQAMMTARQLEDQIAAIKNRNVVASAPVLKASPSQVELLWNEIKQGAGAGLTEGIPHSLGNLYNSLTGRAEVPSGYARRVGGVMGEEAERSWPQAISEAVIDPSNFVGGAVLRGALAPVARAAKRIAPTALVGGSAAYAEDAEAAWQQKMLQGLYRGYAGDRGGPSAIAEGKSLFASPQREAAERYAAKRAVDGKVPHLEMLMVDPFAGRSYGHAVLGTGKDRPLTTIARELQPEEVQSIHPLYAQGGSVEQNNATRGSVQNFAGGGLALLRKALTGQLAKEAGTTSVIKNKGGPVQKFAGGGLALLRKALTGQLVRDAGTTSVVKNKGGNWLSGSVEGALRGLKKAEPVRPPVAQVNIDQASRDSALNKFIDKKLTGYVKNQMATPEDPVRALAEQGILHYTPQDTSQQQLINLELRRAKLGQPKTGMGEAESARIWERLSDDSIGSNPASTYQNFGSSNLGEEWINKLDPNTPFYQMSSHRDNLNNLGFSHLTDELSNSLNAQSGLPAHLQLKPQDLDKMGMDQAVRHVAKVNDWRAAQKMELDAMRANNAATVLHKEYPENNPKGLRWMELKRQEGLPEGWTTYDDPITGTKLPVTPEGKTITGSEADPRYAALRDALKYEGDTMGHCVGGYCDDVASGRTRIMSLRDAKGEPHVTIEIQPTLDVPSHIRNEWRQANARDGSITLEDWIAGNGYENQIPTPVQQRIVQIKGSGKKDPGQRVRLSGTGYPDNPDAYLLPYIQDFVKSGQWSDVGDLQNTGLVKLTPESFKSLGPSGEEAYSILKQRGEFLPETEMKEIYDTLYNTGRLPKTYYDEDFAHGGSVNQNNPLTSTQLQAIIQRLRQEHSHA